MRDVGTENLATYFRFEEHRTSKRERGGRCERRPEKERGRCGGKRKTKVCRRTEGTGFKCNLLQSRRKLRAPSTRNAHVCPSLGEHACSYTTIDCNVRRLISREYVDEIYACIRRFFSRTNHTAATIRITVLDVWFLPRSSTELSWKLLSEEKRRRLSTADGMKSRGRPIPRVDEQRPNY